MNDWILKERGFNPEKVVELGNRFLTGNGYLGYRGTPDEFRAAECVGLNVAGVYDGVGGKWRETVNAFNPFYLSAACNGVALDVRSEHLLSHEISLDIARGLFFRRTLFRVGDAKVELATKRFVSMADKNLLCARTTVISTCDADLTLTVGVDGDVWELNGPHYRSVEKSVADNVISVRGITQEKGVPVTVSCRFSSDLESFNDGFARISVKLKANVPFVLERIACVACGEEPRLPAEGYEEQRESHDKAWRKLWRLADVRLDGCDARAQFALRYSIYHLLILAPQGDYSIAARGLSGQTYKGAVFWDTEIFLLPFYLTVFPEKAKKLVQYRVNTLAEAQKKARHYGYAGAFYAWESQDGYDACSDFNVVDVFTHRPVRTYFKDKQIHISADVAYALFAYYDRTKDNELMLGGGLKTALECVVFLYSYSYFNHVKGRYELLDVIGPDEYHERVNNNAYTNYMAHYCAVRTVEAFAEFRETNPNAIEEILEGYPGDILHTIEDWAQKLYLPQPDGRGVIQQFDGYFSLEDISVEGVRARLVLPNEYWGGSGGVATATRVIKQADVIMLFNLLPDECSAETVRANYEFYLPYTEHGSSLSHCAYALTACRVGEKQGAWNAFLNSAEIDLRGGGKQWAGEVYIGGTHPAASGGAWMTAVCGFAGLVYGEDGRMRFAPSLPENLTGISFTASERGEYYRITVCGNGITKEKINEI